MSGLGQNLAIADPWNNYMNITLQFELTWLAAKSHFNMEYIFKRSIFHCHVSLPKGKFSADRPVC